MKVEDAIKMFKQAYTDSIVLVKVGSFFHAYGRDSYILSYLFNYQLKNFQNNHSTCGFPISSLDKVSNRLEQLEINYIALDKSQDFKITEKKDFTDNKYSKIYSKAHNYISIKSRIDTIYQFLLEGMAEDNILDKIIEVEKIIY